MNKTSALVLVLLALAAWLATAAPVLQAGEQAAVAVTVYNSDLGVVKDVRTVKLSKGLCTLEFTDVAAKVDPSSVKLQDVLKPDAVQVLEQNFQYDLINPAKLLEKYLGKEIRLKVYNDQGELVRTDTGILLSTGSGADYPLNYPGRGGTGSPGSYAAVVKVGDKLELAPPGQVELPDLPGGLRIKPTLQWLLDSKVKGERKLEITYCTSGLTWRADYVLMLNEDDTQASLNGWVTLNNTSGTTYENAKLKLVAGTIHRVSRPSVNRGLEEYGYAKAMAAPGGFKQESFFEYHLYSLQRPTTLHDREVKQVSLLSTGDFKVSKQLEYTTSCTYNGDPERLDHPEVKLTFANSAANGLGMPLPEGIVKVYKRDASGSRELVGEDRIEHTPRDEQVWLTLGKSFDVTALKQVVGQRSLGNQVREYDCLVRLKNHKDTPVQVVVKQKMHGTWRLLKASAEGAKTDAYTEQWTLTVPAGGSAELTYTVRFGEYSKAVPIMGGVVQPR